MQKLAKQLRIPTQLNPIYFLLGGFLTFFIGALTVSVKSYQAAKINPVKTLKDERIRLPKFLKLRNLY